MRKTAEGVRGQLPGGEAGDVSTGELPSLVSGPVLPPGTRGPGPARTQKQAAAARGAPVGMAVGRGNQALFARIKVAFDPVVPLLELTFIEIEAQVCLDTRLKMAASQQQASWKQRQCSFSSWCPHQLSGGAGDGRHGRGPLSTGGSWETT